MSNSYWESYAIRIFLDQTFFGIFTHRWPWMTSKLRFLEAHLKRFKLTVTWLLWVSDHSRYLTPDDPENPIWPESLSFSYIKEKCPSHRFFSNFQVDHLHPEISKKKFEHSSHAKKPIEDVSNEHPVRLSFILKNLQELPQKLGA